MGMFDRFIKTEQRSLENPNVPVISENFLHLMGLGEYQAGAGITINIENAMGVPAIWAATNFISGTLASLPLEILNGNEPVTTGIGAWINRAVNPSMSSFAWRKYIFEQTLTTGRSVTLIVRNGQGTITDLVPLDPSTISVYNKTTAQGYPTIGYRAASATYDASEVIDLSYMTKANMIDVRGPIMTHRDVIGMAIAASRYGAKAFQAGGIPPAVLQAIQ